MKYTGRIITFSIILMGIFNIFYYYASSQYTCIKVETVVLIIIIGYLGRHYDKEKFYARELKRKKEELQGIFDNVDATILYRNLVENKLLVSKGIETITGYSKEEFINDPKLLKNIIIDNSDKSLLEKSYQRAYEGKKSNCEYRIISKYGELKWVQNCINPVLDSKGKVMKLFGKIVDITDLKLTVEKLSESEKNFRNLVEYSPEIILVCKNERIEYANPYFLKIVKARKLEDIIGKSLLDFLIKEEQQRISIELNRAFRGDTVIKEIDLLDFKKNIINVATKMIGIQYGNEKATLILGEDITEKKKSREKIKYMAYYDILTGLPNRYFLHKYLLSNMKKLTKNDQSFAIMFLDLDRFEIINDSMGHSFGDQVLVEVAKRLKSSLYNNDLVCRYSGDEFIIIIEDVNRKEAADISHKIIKEFSEPFFLKKQEVYLSPSIGISMNSDGGNNIEELIKHADIAMCKAKKRGKNTFQFYTEVLDKKIFKRLELENQLRKAVERDEFLLYYQPQINLKTGKISGVEALIRWNHPEYGLVSPLDFIPIAEETGLIIEIGKWVLEKACKDLKSWEEMGVLNFSVGVNISVRQFQDRNFLNSVLRIVRKTEIDPTYLDLEITESVVKNIDQSAAILNQLRKEGIAISIDDFGTGYSSLSVLKYLPIDKIKIDQSFVREGLEGNNKNLLKGIIAMGKSMGYIIVAEGVENKEQLTFLKDNMCDVGQGYYYSKPLESRKIEEYLKKFL